MDKTIISFSSPKGGVGRTMVAANVAAAYVNGCEWAGLLPKPVLLVDGDLSAPGCHYYPFIESFSTPEKRWGYRIKSKTYASQKLLLEAVKKNSQGLSYLLYSIAIHPEFKSTRSKFSPAKTDQEFADQNFGIVQAVTEIVKNSQNDPLNPVNPWNHIIQICDEQENLRMLILPAGDSEQEYFQQVLDFDWKAFFDQNGMAVLYAIYSVLSHGTVLADKYRPERRIPPVERILLDQEAGLSLPSIGNRLFANRQVIVSGLNAQNQDGLFGLLNYGNKSDVRIVLSQYRGRTASVDSGDEKTRKEALLGFRIEDQVRASLTKKLKEWGIGERAIFLADYLQEAINREFFAPPDSHYYNEIIKIIASIETDYCETKLSISGKQIRVLGEFVGIAGRATPSGPLGAFREWAEKHAISTGISVTGAAVGHEDIEEIIAKNTIYLTENPPSSGSGLKRKKHNFNWPINGLAHLFQTSPNDGTPFCLEDFDIVAMPVYLLLQAQSRLNHLEGLAAATNINASDRIGPINEAYFTNSIKGWRKYAHKDSEGESKLVGYPLFVDSQLIAFNKKQISNTNFGEEYFNLNYRKFCGFQEPADVLSAARSATLNEMPNDRLIMTLKHGHIAKWYEWQTVLGMFGARDFAIPLKNPWASLSATRNLTNPKTIRATALYLELCSYAEGSSDASDWDKAIAHFFKDQTVGMAFIWPDAIPREYREAANDSIFEYTVPPGDYHYEECWLLTIPANRNRLDAPTKAELERLLQQFLTFDSQLLYHSLGGVSVHRRVLQSPTLWNVDAWLPEFSRLESRGTMLPRMAALEARRVALKIVNTLELLRTEAKRLAKDIEKKDPGLNPWSVPSFLKKMEGKIKSQFEKIEKEDL